MDDRTRVRLALALTESEIKSECPSAEKLAELIDRRVDTTEKELLFRHLDTCSLCYRQWLEISSRNATETHGRNLRKTRWTACGLATAVAACLVLVLWSAVLRQPQMSVLISSAYLTAVENRVTLKSLPPDRIPVLPHETEIRRSLSREEKPPAAQAFTAGFNLGKKELFTGISPDRNAAADWTDTRWEPCFYLGRWCILLQTVCRSDREIPLSFWQQQNRILNRMDRLFSENYSATGMFELELTGKALKQLRERLSAELSKTYDPKTTCRILEAELEAIKAGLS